MLKMILQMTAVTGLHVLLTALLWKAVQGKRMTGRLRTVIGLIYGLCSVLSTHFGIDYSDMLINVRDMGPLSAGLFFDPVSGIVAGLIGGIERYIAGTYWGIGSYTRIACSVSTCLAGFVAAGMRIFIFRHQRSSAFYAFFMGSVMEVFHMYVVFITHRDDMHMALYVVKTCSPGMIVFTGLGMAVSASVLKMLSGEWKNPLRRVRAEEVPVSRHFQIWLFAVTTAILVLNLLFSFAVQTQTAIQNGEKLLTTISDDIRQTYQKMLQESGGSGELAEQTGRIQVVAHFHVGNDGTFDLILDDGTITAGGHQGGTLTVEDKRQLKTRKAEICFRGVLFGVGSLCRFEKLDEGLTLLVTLPMTEVYEDRDSQTFESAFGAIILFAVIYVMISMLVQDIVVRKLKMVNVSLDRITHGNLDEVVAVRSSSEFASLSDDINQTVTTLKGYIEAAEKRIEEELEFARVIQESSLPKNFVFPRDDFEIYATMDPAREVGGDFYDFFFVDQDRLALVIADVSGKGIPASLFMMRARTAIRGLAESGQTPAEILYRANNALCEGNEAEMFVTVWIGLLDLKTGKMRCANAGHEYPTLMRAGGDYEYLKDKHGLALAAMEEMRFKEYELQLYPGDRLFVYTDGAPEAIDDQMEQYGAGRLIHILNSTKNEPLTDVLPAVRRDISDFAGDAEQFDDITMLGLVFRGTGTPP